MKTRAVFTTDRTPYLTITPETEIEKTFLKLMIPEGTEVALEIDADSWGANQYKQITLRFHAPERATNE